jgi:hypothetical protein
VKSNDSAAVYNIYQEGKSIEFTGFGVAQVEIQRYRVIQSDAPGQQSQHANFEKETNKHKLT